MHDLIHCSKFTLKYDSLYQQDPFRRYHKEFPWKQLNVILFSGPSNMSTTSAKLLRNTLFHPQEYTFFMFELVGISNVSRKATDGCLRMHNNKVTVYSNWLLRPEHNVLYLAEDASWLHHILFFKLPKSGCHELPSPQHILIETGRGAKVSSRLPII